MEPISMKCLAASTKIIALLLVVSISTNAATWYVRSDGAASPTCNGQSNASAASTPNCAFSNPQESFNAAALGDTINLRAGDTFTGNFILPIKAGSAYLIIQSTRVSELPEGVRVSPSQSALFAKLESTTVEPVIATPDLTATHHYKFIGIEFSLNASGGFNAIRLGDSAQTSLLQVPNNLVIDRSYIHGQPTLNSQRGIALNSASTTITNSYISEVHWAGVEAAGIGGWNGPGPYSIINNYIEAAGINVLFGGAVPAIVNLVPSDITVANNYLFKPRSWRVGDPSYAGIHWTIKNLFELKNARRVVVSNNVMENSWADSQIGWAVIFNTTDDATGVIEDVQFTRNRILNTTEGIDLRGSPSTCDMVRAKRFTISDNSMEGIGAYGDATSGTTLQLLQGSEDVTFDHNVSDGPRRFLFLQSCDILRHTNLVVTSNLLKFGTYGTFGDGGFIGTAALNRYTVNPTMLKNALYGINDTSGQTPSQYPANNYFPDNYESSIGLPGADGLPVGPRFTSRVCKWSTTPVCQ